jgi:hypothetical protein
MSSSASKMVLVARIRKDDDLLREYFSKIKPSDWSYEIRRLLEKAILIEQREKEAMEYWSKKFS